MNDKSVEPDLAARQAHWNARACTFDVDFHQAPVRMRTLDEVLIFMPLHARKVIDAGTGTGRTLQRLISHFNSETLIIGVDFSVEMLKKALQGFSCHDRRVGVVSADHVALSFRSGSLDVVVSTFTLHHVPPSQQLLVLKEFRRVLGATGILVLADQVQVEPPLDADRMSLVVTETFYSHLATRDGLGRLSSYGEWPLSVAGLAQLIREAGFDALDVRQVHRIVAVLRATVIA